MADIGSPGSEYWSPATEYGSTRSEYWSPASESESRRRESEFENYEASQSLQGGQAECGRNESDPGCSDDLMTSDTSSFLQRVSNSPYQSDFSPKSRKRKIPTQSQEVQSSVPDQRGNEETDLGKDQLRRRLVSSSNLFEKQPGVSWAASLSSSAEVAEVEEDEIVVDNVPTPPFPKSTTSNRSRPTRGAEVAEVEEEEEIVVNDILLTPPFPKKASSAYNRSRPVSTEQRLLAQKEFDRKLDAKLDSKTDFDQQLNAKRDIFSKGRSISLSALRLPSRMFKSPKKKKKEKRKGEVDQLQPRSVRGELELVNVDQLINVDDLG